MSAPLAATVPEKSAAPMMPPTPQMPVPPKVSVQEYFAFERQSEIRYEYVDGEMIAMPGVSFKHNKVSGNFYNRLILAFDERNCEVYIESIRVRVSPTRYRYPDIVVVCGEHLTDGENPPALLNPNAIVEVLSPSTQSKDWGEKLSEYTAMSSLTDYVLAAQDRISVFHYTRQNARQWTMIEYTNLADAITFTDLSVTIPLTAIYRRVAFPAAPEDDSR